ncbi:MAG: DUF1501 domain-containing protein [Planctomycetes bacterium]|nr:DUF1501 domain-containing protein [Planctomycetota bacterium]
MDGDGLLGRLTRRRLLQVGSLSVAGLSLPRLLAADAQRNAAAPAQQADACIVIFLNGGPSHLDMWDMKPQATEGIRGEFQPIASSLAGAPISEHLPLSARHMHRCTLIRSMHHSVNNSHAAAVYTSITGHDRGDANRLVGAESDDQPTIGSALTYLRPPANGRVPHVCLPYITKEGAKGPPQPGFYGGLLGKSYDPLFILNDPNADGFSVPELALRDDVTQPRLNDRRHLLASLAESFVEPRRNAALENVSGFQQRAFDLLTSNAAQHALDIAAETPEVRERYGRNIYGQSVLLARRLIEAGTRLATISWAPDANATWDTHGNNFVKLKETLLPQFDRAFASLLTDLVERHLLDRTIVAVLGDFGRSPRVNKAAGRDHWNNCYSVLLAGGGFGKGVVYGASDSTGALPAQNPTRPGDVIATLYHLLGISPAEVIHDRLGRPHRLVPEGEVIPALLA